MLIDLHQHMWTEPLVRALEQRETPPCIRRSHGLVQLFSAGEPPYVIDLENEQPDRRAALVREDGLVRAVIAISSPIGIEALPRREAEPLVEAYLEGVLALPEEFEAWGAVALDEPQPDDVDAVLKRGCVGITIPAGALAGPERLKAVMPLLERVQERDVPLFVHPGRAPGQRPGEVEFGEPLWWRPLTDYVWQMQAAWYTFAAHGRSEFPDLKVLWAMLAGGAHLLTERFQARGGPTVDMRDPNAFYETSSYGPIAVETTARLVGEQQLVYGSDRPVVEPEPTGRDRLLQHNSTNLISKVTV